VAAGSGFSPPTIRLVRDTDVPAVVALVRDVLSEFGLRFGEGATTDEELWHLPSSYADHGGAFWVVDAAGALLGTLGVFPVAPDTFELRKMYLRPKARGVGLGKGLLETSLVWLRERSARRVVLDTTEQMDRAIAFYESNGFVRDDTQRRGARCSRGYSKELRLPT
jgi:putative acetyltransferase